MRRFRHAEDALSEYQFEEFPDFRIPGPRSCMWVVEEMCQGNRTPGMAYISYRTDLLARLEQQDLSATVQAAMVRAGLPTVEVQVVDWTVVLRGRVASEELREAATRVAQAEPGVIGVENLVLVPEPIVTDTVPEEEAPVAGEEQPMETGDGKEDTAPMDEGK